MTENNIRVIPLARTHMRRAAEIMLCAYRRDPMMEYVLPEEERDTGKTLWFIKTSLRYGFMYGVLHTTPDVSGVAVWLPPEHPEMRLWGLLTTGMLFAPFRLGRKAFRRLMNCVEHTHRIHKEVAPGRHWYLFELAVDPASQGQGIGSALIRPVLDRADRESLPCYLETFTNEAVRFYERHGFRVVEEGPPERGGPICWVLLREPGGS